MSPPKTAKQKPKVSVVGSGRLGTALALALSRAGYTIVALVARHLRNARKSAALLEQSSLALGSRGLNQLPESEIIIIATPDDTIPATAAQLALAQTNAAVRQTVLHTSGALSSEVLTPLAKRGFHTGSMHPLVSISDPVTGANALSGAFFCLEGDQTALRRARSLVRDLKGHSFSVDAEGKALYHAAAVMASGHVVALLDLAIALLVKNGLSHTTARHLLLPLLESTLKNLSRSAPGRALTGTFARGDLETVRRHLDALGAAGVPDAIAAYKLLGRHSLELAGRHHLDDETLKQIQNALE